MADISQFPADADVNNCVNKSTLLITVAID